MFAQFTATVVDGELELDHPVALPNNTRVSVTVRTVSATPPSRASEKGWSSLKRRIQERPVHAGGLHYSRDELHERR